MLLERSRHLDPRRALGPGSGLPRCGQRPRGGTASCPGSVCSMGRRWAPACLPALPWGLLQGCPGGPSPGPTEGGRWPRLSLKPLALADPVSRGPRRLLVSMPVEAGLAASGRGAQAPPSTDPPAALSSPSGGCREAVTGVWCGGGWPRPGPGSAPSPLSLHLENGAHGTSTTLCLDGVGVKQWAAPGAWSPLLGCPRGPGAEAAFEGLASGHRASEPGRRGGQGKSRCCVAPLARTLLLRWGLTAQLSSCLCPALLTGTALHPPRLLPGRATGFPPL